MELELKPELKKCSYCKKSKELIQYSKDNYTITGIHYTCKECDSSLNKQYLRSIKGKYSYSKRKAAKRKLSWIITLEQYEYLLKQPCYYCKTIILNDYGCGLDRIDNSKGYLINNVLPCCKECNRIRHTYLTVREMLAVAKLLKEMRNDSRV